MSRTWKEELWKKQNAPFDLEKEVDAIRGSLLAKLTMAYNFLVDNSQKTFMIENAPIHMVSPDDLIFNNFNEECLRMLLVNYSVVLIGMGRNDKVSIYNDPAFKDRTEVKEFYEKWKGDIKMLKLLRDKIYSHIDPNIHELMFSMPLNFIKELILFVTKAMGIDIDCVRHKPI